ncbi:MAG: hypothetical protein A2729_01605 [Candidatus Buchananbacteria bacterium RIFCSPHIGHO2_01_FULL_39_14]|uniref:Yip1 domain-containing protein n=1 Tax=Candidatus Buchananbacteria bacterium RIFCSPHIGHO2_01_FULL_39_14 TaxID=1797532 RepID=A0A1G1XWU5_9BACT|nr:MAG: hypothetical protein A2729_01605 [Candidatus Buchananbacteria bacterium RIFCSPHIGHO2_01_FULL_39_14]OGY48799.1 MAG: hypothetical protein A3D39_03275 [Candidatus Buchananbacteria bacterium RIFCSPHIGHO2_02_FULL_39_17]
MAIITKKSKKIIFPLLLALIFLSLVTFANAALTDQEEVKQGLDITAKNAQIIQGDAEEWDLATIVGTIINYLFGVIAIVFLTFILIGGYLWMSATGNEEGIKKAKAFILNSIFGLMVIFLAYTLVWLILNALKASTLSS